MAAAYLKAEDEEPKPALLQAFNSIEKVMEHIEVSGFSWYFMVISCGFSSSSHI